MSTNWTQRYLHLAKTVSQWSKDPSTQIGAVAVGESGQILSQGYNGFPRGIEDSEERLNDRETKYGYIVHGEMNCIYNACLNGVSLKDSSMYVWGLPVCHICCNGLIQVGVKKIIMGHPTDINPNWNESWEKTKSKLIEARVWYTRNEYEVGDSQLDAPRTLESAGRVNRVGHYVSFDHRGDEPVRKDHYDRPYL